MLKHLKRRLLGDDRTVGVVADIKSLYESADDPHAFRAALSEGDFDTAAEHHPLSADELRSRFANLRETGEELESEYSEVTDKNKDEFVEARLTMVDLPGVGNIPEAVMAWCLIKCTVEAGDRQLRGDPEPKIDATQAFTMCFTDCITPGLPEPQEESEAEPATADDDDDD